jgi:hypothetical protein
MMAFRILLLLTSAFLLLSITCTALLLWYHCLIDHIPHCCSLLCTAIISDLSILGTDMPHLPWRDAADAVRPR